MVGLVAAGHEIVRRSVRITPPRADMASERSGVGHCDCPTPGHPSSAVTK